MWWTKHYDLKCLQCQKVIGIVTTDNLQVLCNDCQNDLTMKASELWDLLAKVNYELVLAKKNLKAMWILNKGEKNELVTHRPPPKTPVTWGNT